MKTRIQKITKEVLILNNQEYDLNGNLDLRNTKITELSDNLKVDGSIYKDFQEVNLK